MMCRMIGEVSAEGTSATNRSIKDIRILLIFVGLFSLATNSLYLSYFNEHYFPDSLRYITAASNLSQGHGYTDSYGFPETQATPGYPLLIAAFLRLGISL